MARESRTIPPTGGTPSAGGKPGLLVLHIEDSPDDQILFQHACQQAYVALRWHQVESAAKGIAYLKDLAGKSRLEPVWWPDLVLLDLMLPGQDGFAVLQFIRATPELQRMPVIILTGHQDPVLINEAYRLGANSILLKPSTFRQLLKLVDGFCEFWTLAKRPEAGVQPETSERL